MKVELVENKKQSKEWKYPLLVISDIGQIVFAIKPSSYYYPYTFEGFILEVGRSDCHNQHYSNAWGKDAFKPYDGKVILSNEDA